MDLRGHPLYGWLSALRRDLHAHPELAFQEHRTTRRIQEELGRLGISSATPPGMETGVVALVPGASPGPVLALRADIDALPVEEKTDAPYRSTVPGVMHACGHDAHAAILLGVARTLVEGGVIEELAGTVKLIFQPAEEAVSGARAMIQAGVLADPPVDRILACHVWPDAPVGTAACYRGVSHAAADRFAVEIRGKGAHGAYPHKAIDPVLAGAHFVTAIQSVVSRNVAPTESAVVTVGRFRAGTAANVIPETALIEGTVRSFTPEVRRLIRRRLEELCRGTEAGFGVQAGLRYTEGVPPCINDPATAEILFRAASGVLGGGKVRWLGPQPGAEDFALFTREVPGALIRLGCTSPGTGSSNPLHSPLFDLDEAVLPAGVEILSRAAQSFLARP